MAVGHQWAQGDAAVSRERFVVRVQDADADVLIYGTGTELLTRRLEHPTDTVLAIVGGVPTLIGLDPSGTSLSLTSAIDGSKSSRSLDRAVTSVIAVDGAESSIAAIHQDTSGGTTVQIVEL
jgi:hypothetical protein